MLYIVAVAAAVAVPLSLWLYARYITEKPRYYIKAGSLLHRKAEKHIRLLHQEYQPSWWCPFGNAQTVARQLIRDCPSLPFEREIVDFPDGGCAGIDWLIPDGTNERSPIVVFLPGITGSTHDCSYILHPVVEAMERGWRSVVINPRGLGGVPLRTAKTYNAAYTGDVTHIISMITTRFPEAKKLGCGFSMGGIILWHYVTEHSENAQLDGAMMISSPWDPVKASESIERFIPRLLFNRFLANNLRNIVKDYKHLFEHRVDWKSLHRAKTVRQFDTAFVVPMFDYKSIDHYFEEVAMYPKVNKVRIPTVTLNAMDDCFAPVDSIPLSDIAESEHVLSIITAHGGHTAFMEKPDPNARGLVERLLHQWGTMILEESSPVRLARG